MYVWINKIKDARVTDSQTGRQTDGVGSRIIPVKCITAPTCHSPLAIAKDTQTILEPTTTSEPKPFLKPERH